MTDANTQILTLAKHGLSAEEISEQLGYDADNVMVVLSQAPSLLRTAAAASLESEGTPAEGSNQDLENRFAKLQSRALDVLATLLDYSNDNHLQMKIAMYITDQRLGLKKAPRASTTFNIVQIENHMKRVREITALRDPVPTPEVAA